MRYFGYLFDHKIKLKITLYCMALYSNTMETDGKDYIMKCDNPIYTYVRTISSPLPATIDGTGKCRHIYLNNLHNQYYASAVPPNGSEKYTGNYIRWNWDAVWLKKYV
jgi:hypothetical protein